MPLKFSEQTIAHAQIYFTIGYIVYIQEAYKNVGLW